MSEHIDPGRWSRLEEVFDAALAMDPEQRRTYLAEACADDEELHRQVMVLLAADAEAGELFGPTISIPRADNATSRRSEDEATLPVSDWDRYELIRLLGEGGMGRVYLARDPRLGRLVALKFLRSDDPAQAQRLVHEARTQARIGHDRVCEVYEAGEVQGRPYIAMRYLKGSSIASWAAPLEQKVEAIRAVCEAVHAAHRLGVIHRDIKPSNIVMEPSEDGPAQPFIMDFGIARELSAPGQTATGLVMGTPSYMSPEQACGEPLDRRSDVYSLGATLYHLLAGQPPFTSSNPFDVLYQVMHQEPPSLCKRESRVPVDLETIVMKCLEREPQRRYGSARALGEDLERFLAGEPVLARRPSWSYRVARKARKHRGLLILAAALLAVIMVLAGMWVRDRRHAAERTRLAQRFGQEVEGMEVVLRLSHLMPLHDIRPEKERVRSRMQLIRAQSEQIGPVAAGPAAYALGRGHLALGEYHEARRQLELAWSSGYRHPHVAVALGLAMGRLYQQELAEIDRISDADVRTKRRRQAEAELRDPAVASLKQAGDSAAEAPAYVDGLIALYEQRYEQALQAAADAVAQTPWLYEAWILGGQASTALGIAQYEEGAYEGARQRYHEAEQAFSEAVRIGESDPDGYEGLCGLWNQVLKLNLIDTGGDQTEVVQQATDACGKALQADPDRPSAHLSMAMALYRWAHHLVVHDQDPRPALEAGRDHARQAISLAPDDAEAHTIVADCLHLEGAWALDRGEDPSELLEASLVEYQRALETNPTSITALTNLATVYLRFGMFAMDSGRDPRPQLQQAIAHYERSLELYPDSTGPHNNLGIACYHLGEYQLYHGEEPQELLSRAVESFLHVVEVNPNHSFAIGNLGNAQSILGYAQQLSGSDPRPVYAESVQSYQRAIEINPDHGFFHMNLGGVYCWMALYLLDQGLDAEEELQRAFSSLVRAQERIPGNPQFVTQSVIAHLLGARSLRERGQSPEPELQAARQVVERARAANPALCGDYLSVARIEQSRARWLLQEGRDPTGAVDVGVTEIRQALEKQPDSGERNFVLAELCRVQAEWELRQGRSVVQLLERGLTATERALSDNPRDAGTMALKGELHLIAARAAGDDAGRSAAAQAASAALRRALELNHNLEHRYRPLAEEAAALTRATTAG